MCNVSGGPATVAHKLDVLRGHCTDVGRDAVRDHSRPGSARSYSRAARTKPTGSPTSCRGMAGDQFGEQFTVGEADEVVDQVEHVRRRGTRRPHLQHAALRSRHRDPRGRTARRSTSRSMGPCRPASRSVSGYSPDARLLIVNCDDLGSSRSANVAVYEALRDGIATSATLMVPCPWARDAAAMYRGEDVGVHLTLTSEWDQLPVGTDHPLAEPARRRRRVPAHGRGRLGPRRSRRGAQGVPRPDRTGDLLGLRRLAPRQPHGHDASSAPRSSTSTSRSPSTSGCRCAWRPRPPSG